VVKVEKKEMKKPCPLIENGIKPSCWYCLHYHQQECIHPEYIHREVKSDKATQKVYKCLSCKDVMTLYFEDEKLEEVKEVVPREYRGSRKLITKPAGKYTQEGGEIYHRHPDGSLNLCEPIKRRVK